MENTMYSADFYNPCEIKCDVVNKIGDGHPNVVDLIMNKDVCLVINTETILKTERQSARLA